MRNRREAALKAWETIRAKRANNQSEFQAFCEVMDQEEKEYKKELRKAILRIGGGWDKDFENIPVTLKRKNGFKRIGRIFYGAGVCFRPFRR